MTCFLFLPGAGGVENSVAHLSVLHLAATENTDPPIFCPLMKVPLELREGTEQSSSHSAHKTDDCSEEPHLLSLMMTVYLLGSTLSLSCKQM